MKRNLLLIASSLLLGQSIYAQQISIVQARSRAYDCGMKNSARKAHARGQQTASLDAPELVYTCHSESDQRVCFYVFNLGNDEGYVIVGGDEVAKEILGYSESGSFDWETAPENEKWWLSQYQAEISAAMDLPEEERQRRAPRRGAAATTQERVDIPFMLTTKWSQRYPYNIKVNEEMEKCNNPGDFPTGCVATAAAQVMKYHQYPWWGVGEAYCSRSGYQLYADFSTSYYRWSLMADGASTDRTEQDAVALLMYDLGVATDMTYMSGQSSTSIKLLGYALIDNFKYDKSIENRFRIFHTDEEWENMIYHNLWMDRPVIYAGDGLGSHCFVCDGYRAEDNAFHFNWGWGASGNYYQLSGTDIHFLYPDNQAALFGVQPNLRGDYVPLLYCGNPLNSDGDHDFAMKLSYSGEKIMSYDYDHSEGSQSMYFSWSNCVGALTTQEIEMAIQATERTTGYTVYLCGKYRPSTTAGRKNHRYDVSTASVEVELEELALNGTYDLKPVSRLASKFSDDYWFDVALCPSVELPTITVINGTNPGEVRDFTFSISDNRLTTMSEPMPISHPLDYHGKMTYTSSDPSIAIVNAKGEIIPVGAGLTEITVVGKDEINGVKIYNGTTQTFEVYVEKSDPSLYYLVYTNIYYTHTDQVIFFDLYDGNVTFISSDPNIFTVDADGTIHPVSPGESWLHIHAEETDLFYELDVNIHICIWRNMAEFYEEPYTRNDGNLCEGESIYLPLIDHGSIGQWVDMNYKVSGRNYVNSDYYIMEPEAEYLQELKIDLYKYDQPYTIEFYRDNLCTDPYNIPSMTITYRRKMEYAYTVPESGYGTLLLPFCTDVPDGWEVFACPELNAQGNTAMLERAATIARNKPYIIKAAPGSSHTFIGPMAIDATSPTFAQGELKGAVIADNMNLTTSDYVLDTRDGITAFYRYQAGDDASAYCDVFRAVIHPETTTADVIYLQLPGPWGDVNGDDRVSVGDVTTLVGHLKGDTPLPFVKGNADADKNGQIDNQDVEAVRNLIIKRVNP